MRISRIITNKNINTHKSNLKQHQKKQTFKGLHNNIEDCADNHLGYYNHMTDFFRYDFHQDDEEYLIKLLKNRNQEKPLEIVSIGCSYGEEPYSISMALDDLPIKPQIDAIDISKTVIDEAKIGKYTLSLEEKEYLQLSGYCRHASPFRVQMRDKFLNSFECIDKENQTYKKKDSELNNINFFQENALNIGKIYPNESKDAILCRYVLYHFDKKDKIKFLQDAYKVLKPGGILCLNSFEYLELQHLIKQAGFKSVSDKKTYIYRKPSPAELIKY